DDHNGKGHHGGHSAMFAFEVLSGTTLTLTDTDGDVATLTLTGGGRIDGIRLISKSEFRFEAWILDPIALQTTIRGTVKRAPGSNGIIVISEIIGLDKKESTPLLRNPSFHINALTFSPNATG